jgi:hypothetical protein
MGNGGGSLTRIVRGPEDDEERRRIEQAIAAGAGISIADFASQILNEDVDDEFAEVIKSRLEMAGENDEPFDLEKEIKLLWQWREEMA